MQLPFRLRRAAALLTSSLLLAATVQHTAFARTQEANVIPVVTLATSTLADSPNSVRGNLLMGTDGSIYMVSSLGGKGYGSIAKLAPDNTLSVVYAFDSPDEGYNAYAGLMQGTDGNFYGTTYFGGKKNGGSIFKVTPAGVFTLLHELGRTSRMRCFPTAVWCRAPMAIFTARRCAAAPTTRARCFASAPMAAASASSPALPAAMARIPKAR